MPMQPQKKTKRWVFPLSSESPAEASTLEEPKMAGGPGPGAGFEKWPTFPTQAPLNGWVQVCSIFVLGGEMKGGEAH